MKEFLAEEKRFVLFTYRDLISLTEQDTTYKKQGKWSKKELIGHLIDSASNNHQRFIRAQFTDELVFPGYDQNEWVRIQDYQSESWHSLINLWKEFNLHLIHAIDKIPKKVLTMKRINHNLDRIAMNPVPVDQPATLEYFIKDYFTHLRHHINQVLADK